ncbi:MAG: U32 family peptidase, partial [Chlamydiota bacterium]
ICWDLSVISLCKKHHIAFHISTQASIANKKAAEFYKKLGAERVVLARELNLSQIKEISKIIDTEVFIHGALCVSESGRCFTSQFLFKRSANRGDCLQPCRRAYQVKDEEGNQLKLVNNTVMSAKDLCTLPFIEELKKAGVTSFKIEGRNREPEYVDTVVRVYRKALDKKLNEKLSTIVDGMTGAAIKELAQSSASAAASEGGVDVTVDFIKDVKDRMSRDIRDVAKYAKENSEDSMGFTFGTKIESFENKFSMVEVNEAIESAS